MTYTVTSTDIVQVFTGGAYYWWRVLSKNGQVILNSERMYTRKTSTRKAAKKFAIRYQMKLIELERLPQPAW